MVGMSKRYDEYCPVAHALCLVGERWALLVVLELMRGPKRYTDLADNLRGIGTNILASRRELKPAIRELALWGARSLGPPTAAHELFPGWLVNALDTVLAPLAPPGRFEFRVGDEVASLVDGEAQPGSVEEPDVVVEGDPEGIYLMFVDRRLDLVTVQGDRGLLEQLVDVAPAPVDLQVAT
jgi:hypothetical protein